MKAPGFLLSEVGSRREVTCFHFWFKRTPLAVVLRVNCREAFNAKHTFLLKDEQKEIEKLTLTSRLPIRSLTNISRQ